MKRKTRDERRETKDNQIIGKDERTNTRNGQKVRKENNGKKMDMRLGPLFANALLQCLCKKTVPTPSQNCNVVIIQNRGTLKLCALSMRLGAFY